jgi:hypothetical protein
LGDLDGVVGFNFQGRSFLGYLMSQHCLVRLPGEQICASQGKQKENEQ